MARKTKVGRFLIISSATHEDTHVQSPQAIDGQVSGDVHPGNPLAG